MEYESGQEFKVIVPRFNLMTGIDKKEQMEALLSSKPEEE